MTRALGPLLGLLCLPLWACFLDKTAGTELVPLSEFNGKIDVIWSDSVFPPGPPPERVSVEVTMFQALASGACLRIGSDLGASISGHALSLDDRGSTQAPFAPSSCSPPSLSTKLSRADLDGSDGLLRIGEGSTSIALVLPRFFAPRAIETAPPARVPVGSTFPVIWSSGVEWAPDSTPDRGRVGVFLYAAPDYVDTDHSTALTVTTDGTTSSISLPTAVAPGAYRVEITGYPFLPRGDCPPATCSAFAAVGRFFDLEID